MVPHTEEKNEVKEEAGGGDQGEEAGGENQGEEAGGGDQGEEEAGGENQGEEAGGDDQGEKAGGEDQEEEEAGGEEVPEDIGGNDDEEEEDVDDEEESTDEKQEESKPQATDKTEKTIKLTVQPKGKKQPDVLNLNNEVVKMRKEVKRVRALITRKLTRQIAALKKKKGKETEIERNQRRAARLLEEIHVMKVLVPDQVTKKALQKNLNFEQVCKNPKSNISDRAVARIATHQQFKKKIEDIKAAVKAFKEERMKAGKKVEKRGRGQNQDATVKLQSSDRESKKEEGTGEEEEGGTVEEEEDGTSEEEEDGTVEQSDIEDTKEEDDPVNNTEDATVSKPEEDARKPTLSAELADNQKKIMPEFISVRPAATKNCKVKDINQKTQTKAARDKPDPRPEVEALQTKKDEESDLDSSDDEEKQYFDDSTEERFHKQSSQSDDSDSGDDFFVGKVSKFKKKKTSTEGEKVSERQKMTNKQPTGTDQFQSEIDELESRFKPKASKFQSVFCPSLSRSRPTGGRGTGRGGNRFGDHGKQRGGSSLNRDFAKQSKFQMRDKEIAENSGSNHRKPFLEGRRPQSEETNFTSTGRGRGRGRGDFKQIGRRGRGAFTHQPAEQALHPSWEASKKRKEQQGQILAFQGKKIKFDDD